MAGSEGIKGRAIFISYRRDDSEGEAGRLFDDLVRAYGDSSVFMDVAGIEPGLDFRKAIDANVASCGVLLAVIGSTWATVTDSSGNRRLDSSNDFVRLEISSALTRNIPVIPVLVHDARMPLLEQLPDDLKDLRYRNSVELTHARWNSDVALLVAALKSYVSPHPANPEETVHANLPVQLPPPQPATVLPIAKKSQLPLFVGLGALVLAVLLAVGFVWLKHSSAASQQAASPNPPVPATNTTPAPQPASLITQPATPAPATAAPQPAPKPSIRATPVSQPVASPAPAAEASPEVALLGIWKKAKPDTGDSDNIERLSVVEFGGQLIVRAYGSCPGKPCDWGTRKATMNGNFAVTAAWEPRNTPQESDLQRKVSVSMAASPTGTLMVTVRNQTVVPNRGHMQSMKIQEFKKAS